MRNNTIIPNFFTKKNEKNEIKKVMENISKHLEKFIRFEEIIIVEIKKRKEEELEKSPYSLICDFLIKYFYFLNIENDFLENLNDLENLLNDEKKLKIIIKEKKRNIEIGENSDYPNYLINLIKDINKKTEERINKHKEIIEELISKVSNEGYEEKNKAIIRNIMKRMAELKREWRKELKKEISSNQIIIREGGDIEKIEKRFLDEKIYSIINSPTAIAISKKEENFWNSYDRYHFFGRSNEYIKDFYISSFFTASENFFILKKYLLIIMLEDVIEVEGIFKERDIGLTIIYIIEHIRNRRFGFSNKNDKESEKMYKKDIDFWERYWMDVENIMTNDSDNVQKMKNDRRKSIENEYKEITSITNTFI